MDLNCGDTLKSDLKLTCSGGTTEVRTGLEVRRIHGRLFYGCRVDLVVQILNKFYIFPKLEICVRMLILLKISSKARSHSSQTGASGVGFGNFGEIGPLDTDLRPRNSTWLQKADLLFVDNPVGTGYSYVEDEKLLVKTDNEAAADLTTLLIAIFGQYEDLQKSPVYIVAESYGGKYAVTLGLSTLEAIEAGTLKLYLGGVALGDSWISPEDFVFAWAPLLKDVSRIDNSGVQKSNRLAQVLKQQIANGLFDEADDTWTEIMNVISSSSNNVDFHNFLLDSDTSGLSHGVARKPYIHSLSSSSDRLGALRDLMNAVIRKKLKIIPDNVQWGGQSVLTCNALGGDFLKPRISEVDALLAKGVNVTIYNGQLDVLVSARGTEAWVAKLKWDGLKTFLIKDRTPIYCGDEKITKAFTKSYRNLNFYWILEAGHYVPVDQPRVALDMVGRITQSPASTKTYILAHDLKMGSSAKQF
ncbi:hypothetical protein LguiA_021255 [Lonicera macranthoides]